MHVKEIMKLLNKAKRICDEDEFERVFYELFGWRDYQHKIKSAQIALDHIEFEKLMEENKKIDYFMDYDALEGLSAKEMLQRIAKHEEDIARYERNEKRIHKLLGV